VNGKTELSVDMDVVVEFTDYFQKILPNAVNKVKEMDEKN
jgi:hypothetical protein